jgi:fructokinase
MKRYGLIEGGGTKFLAAIADEHHRILARQRIATTTPAETLGAAIAWLRAQEPQPAAIGLASFGPLQLDRKAPDWGHVTATPKPHWAGTDIVGPFAAAFDCPIGLETDVNGAALAEARWGAGRGCGAVLYLTIGTGIGGGFVADGTLLQGLSHPEMGHIPLPRHQDDAGFAGSCPFHGDCLEGLASGTAIQARWGRSLAELGAAERGMIAWYLGRALTGFRAVLSPERIVLGGGVMASEGLLDLVRSETEAASAGYFVGDAQKIVTLPGLGGDAGLMGALAVALAAG